MTTTLRYAVEADGSLTVSNGTGDQISIARTHWPALLHYLRRHSASKPPDSFHSTVTAVMEEFHPGTAVTQRALIDQLCAALAQPDDGADDSENWRALMRTPRIRVYGFAGVEADDPSKPKGNDEVHFGFDVWSRTKDTGEQSGERVTELGRNLLKALAADIRSRPTSPATTEKGE